MICPECGLLFNRSFDENAVDYSAGYENALHHSAVFGRYARGLAESLVEQADLRGRDVVDVGCGDGRFLEELYACGAGRGFGFDPSAQARQATADNPITIVTGEFDAESAAGMDIGLISARHVLEHLTRPLELLRTMRAALGSGTQVLIEVPSADYMLRERGFWDIIHEHVTYFSAETLRRALARCGLEAVEASQEYAGQFLAVRARAAASDGGAAVSMDAAAAGLAAAREFGTEWRVFRDRWEVQLRRLRDEGRVVALWGAGSKAVSFLNALQPTSDGIRIVVDKNPRKAGCHVVGTGQRIMGPEGLREEPADTVILLNEVYEAEVQADLAALGCEATLLTPGSVAGRPREVGG